MNIDSVIDLINVFIVSEPDFPYLEALAPYQPLAMKVRHIVVMKVFFKLYICSQTKVAIHQIFNV